MEMLLVLGSWTPATNLLSGGRTDAERRTDRTASSGRLLDHHRYGAAHGRMPLTQHRARARRRHGRAAAGARAAADPYDRGAARGPDHVAAGDGGAVRDRVDRRARTRQPADRGRPVLPRRIAARGGARRARPRGPVPEPPRPD